MLNECNMYVDILRSRMKTARCSYIINVTGYVTVEKHTNRVNSYVIQYIWLHKHTYLPEYV
uniref:Uncharacterized protein n=1 Tax=Anguilla anguilla TaxID=7936 RepID=A0A0E9PNX0_ANGAN